jgi:hypothetical protein
LLVAQAPAPSQEVVWHSVFGAPQSVVTGWNAIPHALLMHVGVAH